MALAHCILGKFLGVVCHCFPLPLDVPTFAARCLYVRNDARDPSSERWNCGREICPVILPKFRLPRKFRDLLHAANLPTALLPLRRKACWGFFRPKNPTASAGFEPTNLSTKGQHSTPRPPKPFNAYINVQWCISQKQQNFIMFIIVLGFCCVWLIHHCIFIYLKRKDCGKVYCDGWRWLDIPKQAYYIESSPSAASGTVDQTGCPECSWGESSMWLGKLK